MGQDLKIIAQLSDFQIIMPQLTHTQENLLLWLAHAHARAESLRTENSETSETFEEILQQMKLCFNRFGCKPPKIESRSLEPLDAGSFNWDEMSIYHLKKPEGDPPSSSLYGKGMGERMKFFLTKSTEILEKFYPLHSIAPQHIVHVSCTGYNSPSAPQRLINRNKWTTKTQVTHSYHMGCYASIPSVRTAEGLVSALQQKNHSLLSSVKQERVDIVHNEICGLHLNPLDHSPEQTVIQSLFADGHIKYSLTPYHKIEDKWRLALLHTAEQIIEDTEDHMTWAPDSWGMKMTLSREVPRKIASHIIPFVSNMLDSMGLNFEEVMQSGIFAIHPGGPKIIDSVQDILKLREHQVAHSREILRTRGNMSSATLPHIWKNILEDQQIAANKMIISLAFGPGLTVFGSVFKKVF